MPEHNGELQEKTVGAGRAPPINSKHSECSKLATVCNEQFPLRPTVSIVVFGPQDSIRNLVNDEWRTCSGRRP